MPPDLPPLPAEAPAALHRTREAMRRLGFAYYREGPQGAPTVIPHIHGVTVQHADDREVSD